MPTVVWPVSLPQDVARDGYEERPPQLTLRTQMDVGPAKARRRQTAAPRPLRVQLFCTRAQVQTLDLFYAQVGGHTRFEWRHPRTLAAALFRFVSEPRYGRPAGDQWPVSLDLEILP